MNYGKEKHKKALAEACQKLREQGFTVISLKNRIPDAIAFKGVGSLVEITSTLNWRRALREYQAAYGQDVPLQIYTYDALDQRCSLFYGRHFWTKEDDRFVVEKKENGWSYFEIARKLGLRKEQVKSRWGELQRTMKSSTEECIESRNAQTRG